MLSRKMVAESNRENQVIVQRANIKYSEVIL